MYLDDTEGSPMLQPYSGRHLGPNRVPHGMWNCEQGVDKHLEIGPQTQQVSQELSKLLAGKMPQERGCKGTFVLIRILSLKLIADLFWSLGPSLARRGGHHPEPLACLCRRGNVKGVSLIAWRYVHLYFSSLRWILLFPHAVLLEVVLII